MVFWFMSVLLFFLGLSVLALSSRFDGRWVYVNPPAGGRLSVLALSSRFDGHTKR